MMWERLLKIMSGVAGAVAGFFGEWNAMLTTLAVLMAVDYLSGVIVAWRGRSPKTEHGGVSSSVGFDGLAKKAFILLIMLLATVLDMVLNVGSMVFQTAACWYYIANEGISILENAALMGAPVPGGIRKALEALRAKGDSAEGEREEP